MLQRSASIFPLDKQLLNFGTSTFENRSLKVLCCLQLISAGLAIPFFVGFGVLFANGKSDWDKDGRGILLPGDLFMWFGLIFLDFAFIFGTFYYR